jgi:hypothetical protein
MDQFTSVASNRRLLAENDTKAVGEENLKYSYSVGRNS